MSVRPPEWCRFCWFVALFYAGSVVVAEPNTRPRVGIEVEFASGRVWYTDSSQIHPDEYLRPLYSVRLALQSAGLSPLLSVDSLPETREILHADQPPERMGLWLDEKQREWKVVPEYVVRAQFRDGFELVSPPLESDAEIRATGQAVDIMLGSKRYARGPRSSVHITVDASHLIDGSQDNADASRLVDAILFIESRWPEIYASIGPKRYGTFVNRYSIPLAATLHGKKIFSELASLSRSDRTLQKVRAIFTRNNGEEAQTQRFESQIWKFRAANYGKILGLVKGGAVRAIEFRIPDLSDGESIFDAAKFFQALLVKAPELGRGIEHFKDPFPDSAITTKPNENDRDAEVKAANRTIWGSSPEKQNRLIEELGLDPKAYPNRYAKGPPPSLGLMPQKIDAFLAEQRRLKQVSWGGKHATFGFDAEYAKPVEEMHRKSPAWLSPKNWTIPDRAPARWWLGGIPIPRPYGKVRVDTARFPFLEREASVEAESENIEVKSVPTDSIDRVFHQMKDIVAVGPEEIRSVHLHMRIPPEAWKDIPKEDLDGFFSRLADHVFVWRLVKKNPTYVLEAGTLSRLRPDDLANRGTVRVLTKNDPEGKKKKLGDWLDIELRGFMADLEPLRRAADLVMLAFRKPELIRGFAASQQSLFVPKRTLAQMAESFSMRYEGRGLTPDERHFLDVLEEDCGRYRSRTLAALRGKETVYDRTQLLPLFSFESADHLTPMERGSFHHANFWFEADMFMLAQSSLQNKIDPTSKQAYESLAEMIQSWARAANFLDISERTLLVDPSPKLTLPGCPLSKLGA